eukprot:7728175-Pyramimonas_sp.AAC.1
MHHSTEHIFAHALRHFRDELDLAKDREGGTHCRSWWRCCSTDPAPTAILLMERTRDCGVPSLPAQASWFSRIPTCIH